MEQDRQRRQEPKPKHSQGGLVGNYQETRSEEGEGQDASCERAPGHLVGNYQHGRPDCDPDSPAPPAKAVRRNAVGGQRPPLDGELSPHEVPGDKAKAAPRQ